MLKITPEASLCVLPNELALRWAQARSCCKAATIGLDTRKNWKKWGGGSGNSLGVELWTSNSLES
eukprot:544494-Amphidinium_carterae.1